MHLITINIVFISFIMDNTAHLDILDNKNMNHDEEADKIHSNKHNLFSTGKLMSLFYFFKWKQGKAFELSNKQVLHWCRWWIINQVDTWQQVFIHPYCSWAISTTYLVFQHKQKCWCVGYYRVNKNNTRTIPVPQSRNMTDVSGIYPSSKKTI